MPAQIDRCVKKLIDEGMEESKAWAICTAAQDEVEKLMDKGMDECKAWSTVIKPSTTKQTVSNDSIRMLDNKIDPQTGFLHSRVAICRSGIQEYLGRELGIIGDAALKMFNVLRHPDDVTSEESLATYKNLVVTDNHPSEGWVNIDNIKEYQRGQLSETEIDNTQDEVHVFGVMTITDADLIEKAMNGKVEVSLGYARELIAEDGIYNGIPYQYKYTNIIANHLSVVDRGRCGPSCAIVKDEKNVIILDEEQKAEGVLVKIMINGVEFEVSEEVAKAIEAERAAKNKETEDMEEGMEKKVEVAETANDKLTAKVDDLQAKLNATNDSKMSDVDLNKMVAKRASLVSFAMGIIGDAMPDATDPMAIKKAVVEKHFNISVDGKSDAYIGARFEMVQEDQTSHDASVKKLADDIKKEKDDKQVTNDKVVDDAREAYLKRKGL